MSGVELVLIAAVMAAIAAAVFGSHVANGGFYSDDWSNAADFRFAEPPRILSLAGSLQSGVGTRYLLTLVQPIPHALFGLDMSAHLALAVGLGVVTVTVFYAVLRALCMGRPDAAAMAVLVLVFPWSDSVRLWATAGLHNLSVLSFFIGLIFALRALSVTGRRAALLHGLSLFFYLVAVLIYEAPLPAIALSVLLYVHRAPSLRVATRRWRADVLLALVAFVWLTSSTDRAAPHLRGLVAAPVHFGTGGIALLGHALLPLSLPDGVAAAVAVVLVAGLLGGSRIAGRQRAVGPEVRRWLAVGFTAAAFAVASHLMLFGTSLFPTSGGTDNRGNILAAYCYVPLAYSLLMACLALVRERFNPPTRLPAAAVALTLLLGAGYVAQVRRHIARWDRASELQAQALARLRLTVPHPSNGQTLYVFGAPSRVSAGIPVFSDKGDLEGAVRLMFNDGSLVAYPIYAGTRFVCAAPGMYPSRQGYPNGPDGGYGRGERARYGKGLFVDLQSRRAQLIDSRATCLAATQRFRPGPLFATR